MNMFKQCFCAVALLMLCSTSVAGKEVLEVIVLPFEINAPEGIESLRNQITSLVAKQLKDEGAIVLEAPLKLPGKRKEQGLKGLRRLGVEAGADFVVWGSFTQIGKRYSLDARVLESYATTPPQIIYVEGEGAENLINSVLQLSRDIGIKIFKKEIVAEVVITGNKRIEAEAIKRVIKSKKGDIYSAKHVRDDVKSIYKMGYFGDVRVEATSTPQGKVLTFQVKERETIRNIALAGNKKFDDEKIRGLITTRSGSILNINVIQHDLKEIEKLYKEKGYHHAKVTYEIKPVAKNRADIRFLIEEGKKFVIKKISFDGNNAYSDNKLKDLMKTKEKGFFSWFTSSGDLDPEVLDRDISKIAAYYHNHGYIHAKVGEPELTYKNNWIYITIKVEEGPRFTVGKVELEGDLIRPKEELLKSVKIRKERIYNREVIRRDILVLGDIYSDAGYAYAEISPRIHEDTKRSQADITYVIKKGPLVYFERIIISGNTKTRDKVIRRELKVYEHELFSGKRLKEGTRNLYRLDFFEDIKVNTTKGSADDKMILKVNVKEKPTGAFSFGGGYSSVDHMFAMGSVSQKNLFGRGQILALKAQLGSRTTNYTFSFTEPWLFDIPLSAGFDLYNTTRDYDTYDKDSFGGAIRLGYPIFNYTRASFAYNYEKADIKNLTDDVSHWIRDMEGENTSHTITGMLRRDSRDRIFSPTEGSDNSVVVKHAGSPMGGDIGFTRYVVESGWYIPLFWSTVGFLHGRTGFIHGDSAGKMPLWERFYLGGMNSVRGYDWRDIGPKDPATGDKIGGNKMLQFNLEFIFPIVKKSGLKGVLFYDTGNAYNNREDMKLGELRQSTGFGFRWYSPIGPIRLEYGYILDDKEGQKGQGGWEFTLGAAF